MDREIGDVPLDRHSKNSGVVRGGFDVRTSLFFTDGLLFLAETSEQTRRPLKHPRILSNFERLEGLNREQGERLG